MNKCCLSVLLETQSHKASCALVEILRVFSGGVALALKCPEASCALVEILRCFLGGISTGAEMS